MIEKPACFLSFDDWHYKEWHRTLPLFAKYDAKGTFYIAFNSGDERYGITSHMPDEEEWRMLCEIKDAGHVIGYHTWQHKAARWFLDKYGMKGYVEKEIHPGITLFGQHGFDVKHFSYPHGSRTEATDALLGGIFSTVRTSVGPKEIETYDSGQRFPKALDINEIETVNFFKSSVRLNRIVYLFTHNPQLGYINRLLEEILQFGKDNGVGFYSMDAI